MTTIQMPINCASGSSSDSCCLTDIDKGSIIKFCKGAVYSLHCGDVGNALNVHSASGIARWLVSKLTTKFCSKT